MEENNNNEERNVNLDEDIEGVDTSKFDEAVAGMKQAFFDVKDGIMKSVQDLKAKLDEVDLSKEAMQGYFDDFSKAVGDVVDKANETYNNFKNDPKTVEYWNKTKEAYTKVAEGVKTTVNSVYDKAMENEDVKSTVDQVSGKVKEATEYVSGKYQEFTHDPKVRETVVNATKTVSGAFNKAVDTIKTTFNNTETKNEDDKPNEE